MGIYSCVELMLLLKVIFNMRCHLKTSFKIAEGLFINLCMFCH